ncbi:hypothetical protein F5Y05DRAFT_380787 [Hypoxylon sp. FL0543]|nr:hypothetical protein F5Y05DRAFT_380787 [Hypoxylon sp. FL0543]
MSPTPSSRFHHEERGVGWSRSTRPPHRHPYPPRRARLLRQLGHHSFLLVRNIVALGLFGFAALNISDKGSMLIYSELLARGNANDAEPLSLSLSATKPNSPRAALVRTHAITRIAMPGASSTEAASGPQISSIPFFWPAILLSYGACSPNKPIQVLWSCDLPVASWVLCL